MAPASSRASQLHQALSSAMPIARHAANLRARVHDALAGLLEGNRW
jgi:hypothetical protein